MSKIDLSQLVTAEAKAEAAGRARARSGAREAARAALRQPMPDRPNLQTLAARMAALEALLIGDE